VIAHSEDYTCLAISDQLWEREVANGVLISRYRTVIGSTK